LEVIIIVFIVAEYDDAAADDDGDDDELWSTISIDVTDGDWLWWWLCVEVITAVDDDWDDWC